MAHFAQRNSLPRSDSGIPEGDVSRTSPSLPARGQSRSVPHAPLPRNSFGDRSMSTEQNPLHPQARSRPPRSPAAGSPHRNETNPVPLSLTGAPRRAPRPRLRPDGAMGVAHRRSAILQPIPFHSILRVRTDAPAPQAPHRRSHGCSPSKIRKPGRSQGIRCQSTSPRREEVAEPLSDPRRYTTARRPTRW